MSFTEPAEVVGQLGFSGAVKVADFGAGTGIYSLLLAKRLEGGKVYAVEVQKELLDRLAAEAKARHLDNLEFIWGDVEKPGGTKIKDGSVDGVVIANLLFQTRAAYSVALEAKRILRPGGEVAVVDWSDSFGGLGPPPADILKPEKVEQIFHDAGFKLIGQFPAGPYHFGRRFKKSS